jgi:hypothetical protein
MLAYVEQDTDQTLREGIAEFRAGSALFGGETAQSAESEAFFSRHDVVHVLYGCDQSLAGEAFVKIASIFGTTAGLSVLSAYRLHEVKGIYKQLSPKDILTATLGSLPILPRAILSCWRQLERWPWEKFDDRLDDPLNQLRSEFGIIVFQAAVRPSATQEQAD